MESKQLNYSDDNKSEPTQTKITDFFRKRKVYGYCNKTCSWHCLICGENMGPNNPRQLCGKTYCHNPPFILNDEDTISQHSNKKQREIIPSTSTSDYEVDLSDDDK